MFSQTRQALESFDNQHDFERLAALHEHQREIDAFRESDESLGYVFYLMRRG